MNFELKSQLPKETQNEIDRVLAISSGQRTTSETAFLTSLAVYLTNEVMQYDENGLIVEAAGNTVPTGYAGFKKGAEFTKKDATGSGKYMNTGDETSATWDLADNMDDTAGLSGGTTRIAFKSGTPVNAVAAAGTLTSNNTNVTDGKVVVVGAVTYTFKTALTTNPATVPNEILIGADADGTLANLKAAINGAAGEGTSYSTGTVAHPDVSCGNVTSHAVIVTAKVKGTAANSKATTTDETTLSWGAATLAGGVNGTVGAAREVLADSSYLYVAVAANTVADANWRRVALGSAY